MTQNKTGVSTLLLRYQATGQEQLLKANTAVTMSFKDTERAAKELGISMARLQELSNATISPSAIQGGLLGRVQSGQSTIDGFMRDLERIQAAEAKSVQNNQKITAELKTQADLIQRRSAGIRDIGIQRIPEPPFNAFGLGDAAPGRSIGQNITRFGRGLFNAPDVGGSTTIARASIAGGAVVDKLGLSIGQLGVAAGVAAPLAIAAAVALDRVGEAAAAGQRRLAAALTAQASYYDAIANLSTESVEDRLNDLRRLRDVQRQELTNIQGTQEEIFTQLQSRIGGEVTFVGDALARVFDNQVGLGTLREASEKAEQQLNTTNDEIARLEQGLANGAFEANSAREAMEAHTEALRRNREAFEADLRASTNTEADLRVRLAGIRRSGSSSQIQDELAANADREAILRNFLIPSIEDLGLSAEETQERTKEYREELNRLLQTDELLLNVVLPIVQAREAETKALQDQLAAIQTGISYYAELSAQIRTATVDQVAERLNGIEEERRAIAEFLPQLVQLAPTSVEAANALKEAQDSLTSLSLEYNDQITRVLPAALARARAELSADLAKLESERNDKFAEIEANRLDKEAEAAEKRADAYTSAEEKRGDALNDLAERQAEQRTRIEKKSNAEITNAIYARDALAAYLAMQEKQEQLDDLKEDGEKRQREIDKQYEKERQQADRNYARALRDAQQAADKARTAARRNYDIEYNERVTAYNQQLALLRNFVSQANAELSNLTVPSLSTGLVSGASGGTSTPPALPNSPYGVPPMHPYVGQRWKDAMGQWREWNGNGWVAIQGVNSFANGGIAHGLARINDGGGVESGMYNSNQLALFTRPTRIFSAQQTQRLFGGGGSGGGLNINIPIQGSKLTKTQIKDIVDETLDETLPAEWDEAW